MLKYLVVWNDVVSLQGETPFFEQNIMKRVDNQMLNIKAEMAQLVEQFIRNE